MLKNTHNREELVIISSGTEKSIKMLSENIDSREPHKREYSSCPLLETGAKPSTSFPPGWPVEKICKNIENELYII